MVGLSESIKGSLRGAAALRSQNATLHAIICIYATYFLVDTNKAIFINNELFTKNRKIPAYDRFS
jgi:hypothetical protein